ncbi:MAG: acyl-CoA thioesterase [Lachnospiraceae bacterium]|nr:acyl-CoA thioesterase [Lachnospiraceae bacterium]
MKNEVQVSKEIEDIEIVPYEHHTHYHETCQQGVVHHSHYIKWMEDARMDLMEQLGLGYAQMEDMEIMSPMLSLSVEYRSDVKFDEVVVIETKLVSYDGHNMEVAYRMIDKKTGECRAVAKSKHCFVNKGGIPISFKRVYPELDTKFFEFT